jgi:hypothetical protein
MEATYLVSVQRLEQVHDLLEEIADLLLGRVVGVAARFDRVDAGAVLAPLVLPEGLVVAVDVHPVLVHVCQQLAAALLLQDVGDIGVAPRRVTVGLVRAIAVVGPVNGQFWGSTAIEPRDLPQTVDSPRVGRTGGWVGIPELRLKQGATGVVVAAGRGLGRAVAAKGVVVGAGL